MTSSPETPTPKPRRRVRRRTKVIVWTAVALFVGTGVWAAWERYGVHNIFDAILQAEWGKDYREQDGQFQRLDSRTGENWEVVEWVNNAGCKDELEYAARREGAVVGLAPGNRREPCDDFGCCATWPADIFPGILDAQALFLEQGDYRLLVGAYYSRANGTLAQEVRLLRGRTEELDPTGFIEANGVTREQLRAKLDWLMLEKVLPDFLAANPGIGYTPGDWGDVKVVSDEWLARE
jgi:hypothetical protein